MLNFFVHQLSFPYFGLKVGNGGKDPNDTEKSVNKRAMHKNYVLRLKNQD